MTEDYGYKDYIVRALKEIHVEPTQKMIDDLVERFLVINSMIKGMNHYIPNKCLRSTQVMAKIIFDYLSENQGG